MPVPTIFDRRLRVQIVEDERIVAMDLRVGLEQLGFDVTGIASNEADAIRLAETGRPDLVLMDINLGKGNDGIRAAVQIRERFAVPVVFLTAYGEPETLARAAHAAPYGFLLKPFELRELNATVRMAVVRREEEVKTESAQRRMNLALEAAGLAVLELEDGCQDLRWSGQPLGSALQAAVSVDELLAGLDLPSRAAFEALLNDGHPVDLLCCWRATAEPPRWLELHARRFDAEGRVMGMVRDVSLRVEQETRLRQALVVFDATDEAILFLDADKNVLSCNPAFTRMTGWTEPEVRGCRPTDFLYQRRQGDWPELPTTAPDGHGKAEVTCRRADGGSFPALENLCEVLDAQGLVSHHVLSFSDISEIRDTQYKLRHQALHDPLTGLGNRLHLQETLHARTSRPQSPPFALLFIDLDGFKAINDTLGHDCGDELLLAMAQRANGLLRREDVAIRLGGDEFVVLMTGAHRSADALALADKLLETISKPITLGKQTVSINASIGVALYPEHASSSQALLKSADAAMYEAKARGRNRAMLFEHSLADELAEQMQLEQGLRRALALDQLHLVWQPMVDMATGRLLGAEALLRWQHPDLGSVSPVRFIPLAEASGLICPIGAWVIDQACAQAAAWMYAGNGLPRVAVNVSVRQFEQDDVLRLVRASLHRYGLPPERLEIEVTESLFSNGVAMRRVLSSLRELGVKISLDDFGTGFSSLSQLKTLPMDRLKIDKSFVNDLSHDPSSHAIVRTIITLAHSLGLEITAEGVETVAQQKVLQNLGAREAQGWLFHRALTAAQMQELLLASAA